MSHAMAEAVCPRRYQARRDEWRTASAIFRKGRGVEFYYRVKSNDPANSAFIVCCFNSRAWRPTTCSNNYDDLAAMLAGSNDEATFTNYARKTLADADLAAIPAPDDTNNRRDIDLPDQTWASAGGATNNSLGKALVCYDPDTTVAGDATLDPGGLLRLRRDDDGHQPRAPVRCGWLLASGMTDAELRNAAVAELKLTTAGWRKPNGQSNYPSGTAPATTHWGKAMKFLDQIATTTTPPPTGAVFPGISRYPSQAKS